MQVVDACKTGDRRGGVGWGGGEVGRGVKGVCGHI